MGKTHRTSPIHLGLSRHRAIQEEVDAHAHNPWLQMLGKCHADGLAQAAQSAARTYDRATRDGNGHVFDYNACFLSAYKATRRKMRTRLATLTPQAWEDGFDPHLQPRFKDYLW